MTDHLTHERLYRSSDVMKKLASARIAICGCGAIGANLADTLARMGLGHMRLIDFDRIEARNIGTQPWEAGNIGMFKVAALSNSIYRTTKGSVDTDSHKLDGGNAKKLIEGNGVPSLVIDAFDNTAARAFVTEYADRTRVPCLHVGMTADYAEAIWNERYKVPQASGPDTCDYPLARTTIMLAVAVAGETIVRFLTTGEQKSWTITLRDMQIEELI